MDFETIKKELGLDDCSCMSCTHCYHDTDGYYGEIDCGWTCEKEGREFVSNLKYFPFKKDMKCFFPEFWKTRFTSEMTGWDEEDDKVYDRFEESLINLGLLTRP